MKERSLRKKKKTGKNITYCLKLRDGTGALNMCCMLPSGGEDLKVCYRKGLVDELPEGKEPAGAPAWEMRVKQEGGRG